MVRVLGTQISLGEQSGAVPSEEHVRQEDTNAFLRGDRNVCV